MSELRHANCLGPQPAWMLTLRVGHVIARPNGVYRIVREVHRYKNGDLRSVSLVIRRCSWTHRCYTILNANDMKQLSYRRIPVKARRLTKRLDKQIVAALHQPAWDPHILKCCDVEGVA